MSSGKPTNRLLLLGLKVSIAVFFIHLLIQEEKLSMAVFQSVLNAPGWLALAAGCLSSIVILGALRWNTLLAVQNIRLPFRRVLQFSMIGLFFNVLLPGATNGDIIKAYYTASDAHGKKIAAVFTVIADRVCGLMVLCIITGCCTIVAILTDSPGWLESGWKITLYSFGVVIGVAAVLGIVGYFLLKLKPGGFIKNLLEKHVQNNTITQISSVMGVYRKEPKSLVWVFVYSTAAHFSMFVALFSFGRALGDTLSLSRYIFILPFGLIVNALPVSPGGIGVGEQGFETIFSLFDSRYGAPVCALLHASMILIAMVGAVVYLLSGKTPREEAID